MRAKIVCNRTVSLKRSLKALFFQTSIEESNGDSAKLWKALKRLLQNSNKKDNINSINGKDNPLEIVEELNHFFTNVGTNLAEQIPDSNLVLDLSYKENIPQLDIQPTTPEIVSKLLLQISDAKATGDDEIPVRFLKMCIQMIAPILCHIINVCIATKIVPSRWKTAVITPLYKEGDRDSTSNYRPISVLPVISKIMERIVHDQVYDHLRTHGLLSEAQFGFRKYHSTATCILKLLSNIYTNMDRGALTGVVFLDLKKAFDTVDHNILLKKLRTFNLSSETIDWFDSYLSGRKQSVKHQGVKSQYLPVTCGVPQGFILEPLLFILYINDLHTYLNDCQVSLYADDTALYTTADTQIEIKLNLQIELTIVCEWLRANKLTLNVNKTKYVIFGSKNKITTIPDLNIKVGNDKIERVSSMKYLGVILDEHLTFDEHVTYIITKALKKLGILRRAHEYLNMNTKILLYKSLVLPHLDYCDLIYMCTTEENLQRLQYIQNCACRIILRADIYTSVTEMHHELKLPTLK